MIGGIIAAWIWIFILELLYKAHKYNIELEKKEEK
jgi:cell division protein FtsN